MLLYPDADCAVYSANFQEGSPGKDQVVWEGHGLLSWILDSDNGISVSGKLSGEQQYIEVTLQLHPVCNGCFLVLFNTHPSCALLWFLANRLIGYQRRTTITPWCIGVDRGAPRITGYCHLTMFHTPLDASSACRRCSGR